MNTPILTETIVSACNNLVEGNINSIVEELRSSESGKLSVSIPLKLSLVKGRVYVTGKIAWARKFDDEVETSCELDDPNQPKLINE